MPSMRPSNGARSTSANPENIQCASTLARTRSAKGCGETTHCSSDPSSKSLRNRPSSESSTANNAATQISPGEIVCNSCDSGPTASGNRAMTMAKNTNGLASSAGRRNNSRLSRASNSVKTLLMRLAAPDRSRGSPRVSQGANDEWSARPCRLVRSGSPDAVQAGPRHPYRAP